MRLPSGRLPAWLAVAGVLAGAVTSPGRGPAVPPAVHADGPPPAHTGGFGESTCRECHFSYDLNLPGGRVSLEGWPQAYRPNARYELTVVLESEEMAAAGFQLAVRYADGSAAGSSAGTLEALDDRAVVRPDSLGLVFYAQQTRSGSVPQSADRALWTLAWTAPDHALPARSARGAVVAHVAANSADGDNSPLGDIVYATSLRTFR